jgi:hypothetical protein
MSHSWSTSTGSYTVNSSSPSELRSLAASEEERAKRNGDERGIRRAQSYRVEADRWESEDAERKRIGAELKRRKSNNTRARTADFNAQYSPTQEERDKERARAARLRS